MTTQTDLAIQIATEAHEGQTRWDGETPYITHPAAIARSLIEQGYGEEFVAAAWLHDVIEDTHLTEQKLHFMGVDPYIVDIVVILTKAKDMTYLHYILTIGAHPVARIVKIEDIRHNMSCFDKPKGSLYQKYELALHILGEL
jgi:(p)ppGpp synthase/HD superfamily hydrolase